MSKPTPPAAGSSVSLSVADVLRPCSRAEYIESMERLGREKVREAKAHEASLIHYTEEAGGNAWTFNGAGRCHRCRASLGRYDSKYIERAAPHRFLCSWGAKPCWDGSPPDERLWSYYTDG